MTRKQAIAKAEKEFGPPVSGTFWLDEYKPDYRTQCEVCEQSPTVDGCLFGVVMVSTGMCGPCTWGEAACLDPGVWNDPVEDESAPKLTKSQKRNRQRKRSKAAKANKPTT